jgi:hypothetical protein
MAQSFYLREQAERCRRLARDSIYTDLRGGLLKLADEYTERTTARQGTELPMVGAGSDDRDAA